MRHSGAGLAIPDFPLMFGGIVPDHWNGAIAIHFTHRVGALVVAASVLATAGHIWYHHRTRRSFTQPALVLLGLLAVQITLGALTVLTRRDVAINSAHVVCGALVLTTSLVITLRTWRVRFAEVRPKGRHDDYPTRTKLGMCQPAKAGLPRRSSEMCRRAEAGREERAGRGGSGDRGGTPRDRTSRRFRRARQAAPERARGGVERRRLLPRLALRARVDPDGAGRRRHRVRRGRRGGAEPGLRARHGRADDADATAAAAGSARRNRRGTRVRHRARRGGSRHPDVEREPARGARRRRDAGHLPRRLYALEAAVGDLDAGRRRARRAAAAHRMDGRPRSDRHRRLDAVRHRLPVADSALHGDRVDVPRRLPACGISDAAGDRARWGAHGPAGCHVRAGAGAGQPGPGAGRRRRPRVFLVRPRAWRLVPRACLPASRCPAPRRGRARSSTDRSSTFRSSGR